MRVCSEARRSRRRYKSNVIGVITDAGFPRAGTHDAEAGILFAERVMGPPYRASRVSKFLRLLQLGSEELIQTIVEIGRDRASPIASGDHDFGRGRASHGRPAPAP